MLYFFVIMIVITIAIVVLLLQIKNTTSSEPTTTSAGNAPDRSLAEKKYAESVKILQKLADTNRVPPYRFDIFVTWFG